MQILKITSTSAARTEKTILSGLILVAGSDAASIVLNDSTDGSGDDKAAAKAVTNTSSPNAIPTKTVFDTGVYATITGTSAVAYAFVE